MADHEIRVVDYSRPHAVHFERIDTALFFERRGISFWIVDIGSLNGTYVNREPVASAVLANGDEIQIGKFCLVFLTRPTTS